MLRSIQIRLHHDDSNGSVYAADPLSFAVDCVFSAHMKSGKRRVCVLCSTDKERNFFAKRLCRLEQEF
jgi:hypothetical protein